MDKVRISGSTVGVIRRVIVTRLVWLVSLLRLISYRVRFYCLWSLRTRNLVRLKIQLTMPPKIAKVVDS